MSEYDYDEFDDDFDYEEEDTQRKDNNALRELRKANKAKDRQIKELTERLSAVNKSVREQSVKSVLNAKGVNEKVAALIPDSVNSPDEVAEWLSEYGEIFGIKAEQQGNEEAQVQQQIDPAAEGLKRIASMQNSGQPFSNDPDQIAALISNATTQEELNEILFGNSAGPQAI